MTSYVALLALAVPLLAGCRQCPVGGCAPKNVTLRVAGPPRADWPGALSPCLPDEWHARVKRVPDGAEVAVPRKRYEPGKETAVVACLRRVDGVTNANVEATL